MFISVDPRTFWCQKRFNSHTTQTSSSSVVFNRYLGDQRGRYSLPELRQLSRESGFTKPSFNIHKDRTG